MSIKFMNRVWNDKEIEPTQKLVLLAICDNANDEGICYPSIDTIQQKTSLSRPTVIKIIGKLEELNMLLKTQRAKKSGGRYSSLYLVFPLETFEFLDEEFKAKMSQSKEALLFSQSKEALPQKGIQSKEALPKPLPSLFNHHLFKELSSKEKEIYLEYIALRKSLNIKTTLQIHNRLLDKYFRFGRNMEVIEKAINSNWRDFYETSSPKQKNTNSVTLEERIEEAERRKQEGIERWEKENGL